GGAGRQHAVATPGARRAAAGRGRRRHPDARAVPRFPQPTGTDGRSRPCALHGGYGGRRRAAGRRDG
ncbi:MAG: hypothetical protein ACK56I_11470, partial [bacterium]